MPLKQIFETDPDKKRLFSEPCISSEHNPPTHIYLNPGKYEWECPLCHEKQTFIVPRITC